MRLRREIRPITQSPRGTLFARLHCMRAVEPTRWDDLVLAVLLLIIGVPRALLALLYDRPIEVEGVFSLACVVLALLILIWRNTWARPQRPT